MKYPAQSEDLDSLREGVATLKTLGLVVLYASSSPPTVPNCYKGAFKTPAQWWGWIPTLGAYKINGTLQNRPYGRRIPEHYIVRGAVATPAGFRCLSRTPKATNLMR